MEYHFSWLWFFVGFAVIAVGVIWLRFYKQVADNLGSGVASYDRYKLAALITCGVGILMLFNLHTMILEWLAKTIFGGGA
jgi:hypothetical protein